MTDAPPARWIPPAPRELPEWRAEMVESTGSPESMATLRAAIGAGRATMLPTVPGMTGVSPETAAAVILTRSETRRLADASLYYVTPDMTALALAAAQTPPTEPVTLDRLPSPAGLILFGEPIGGYTEDAAEALRGTPAYRPGATAEVTTPIVAVSWSIWTPDDVRLDRGSVQWHWRGQGNVGTIPPDWRGVWLTFYSPRGLFSGLAPDTVIGAMLDGSPMTAGQIEQERNTGGPVLRWDNEMLLTDGARFGPAEPDTTAQWGHVLYTAWQLMAQQGRTQWAETEDVPRERAGRKRDARQGITGPSSVRVVRVHSAHRPSEQAAREDAQQSTGRRAPNWSCRWPVRPYRRSTCMNPTGHASGDCRHEDRIVPGHIKGPEGAPLRTGGTVHLWDSQPSSGGTS